MNDWKYFVYILTNRHKNVLYTGVTSDLPGRLDKYATSKTKGFVTRYNCFYLVYYEEHRYIDQAINREKQIKGWIREKKEKLITSFNPEWKFLNEEILGASHSHVLKDA